MFNPDFKPRADEVAFRAVVLIVCACFCTQPAGAYSSGPDPAYTGAPGENNCLFCHTPPVARAGSVSLTGMPASYSPGATYGLTVTVNDTCAAICRFGFELTAINSLGSQAGNFQTNAATQVKSTSVSGNTREYIEQNFLSSTNKSWTFNWTAPNPLPGQVKFYLAAVRGDGGSTTNGDTTYTNLTILNCAVAAISAQPQSRTNMFGTTATFMVTASSAGTPSYQWRKGGANLLNVGNIAGATTSTLTLTNLQFTNAGSYTVAISNLCGSVTSSVAGLTVTARTNRTNITAQFTVNAVDLSWPADHVGWRLETQTNAPGVGLRTNWTTVSGSAATNRMIFTIDKARGSTFYRLAYP